MRITCATVGFLHAVTVTCVPDVSEEFSVSISTVNANKGRNFQIITYRQVIPRTQGVGRGHHYDAKDGGIQCRP
jgi:hypothetical protein